MDKLDKLDKLDRVDIMDKMDSMDKMDKKDDSLYFNKMDKSGQCGQHCNLLIYNILYYLLKKIKKIVSSVHMSGQWTKKKINLFIQVSISNTA